MKDSHSGDMPRSTKLTSSAVLQKRQLKLRARPDDRSAGRARDVAVETMTFP
jgi:hypothetical protein